MDKEKGKKRKKMTDEDILEEFRLIPSSEIEADEEEEEVLNSDDENEEDNIEFPNWKDDSEADPEYIPSDSEDDLSADDVELEDIDNEIQQQLAGPSKPSTSQAPKKKVGVSKPKARKKLQKTLMNTQAEAEAVGPIIKFGLPKITGKDGYEWSTEPCLSASAKTPKKNIVYTKPGTVGNAANVQTPLESFTCMFSAEMIELVKQHTNEEIGRQRLRYKKKELSYLKDLCSGELNCLLGVLIMAAGLHDNHLSVRALMNSQLCGEKYRSAFSRCRLEFLLNCLRFDDKNTRHERASSKLAPISEVWSMLIKNCTSNYRPSAYLTIDEQLVGFRGNCPFRVYLPSKPNKYGIKIFMMCDNNTKYMLNALIYQGKGTTPSGVSQAEYVVLQLADCVKGTNRNLTFDNWFSSIPLAEKLLKEYGLTAIGTVKKNKRQFPPEFTDPKFMGRKEGTSLFLFSKEMTCVSYKAENKQNKLVVLLSTAHDDANIDQVSGKPEIVLNYNATKGAVDTFDQLCQNINANKKTQRWPMCVFYNMVNIAVHNSYVIYLNNFYKKPRNEQPLSRFDYVISLARDLMTPWMHMRLTLTIPMTLRVTISSFLGLPHPQSSDPERQRVAVEATDNKKHYCYFCSYKKKRMTRFYCSHCSKFICGEHTRKFCRDCAENK